MDNSEQPIIKCANKPRKCEKCGGVVLSILHGYPAHESFEAAGRGEIILGGCCIPDDFDNLEDWVCKECGQRYKESCEPYGEDFSMMADDIGILDSKVMGVFGAMRRGLSKEDALKKYELFEKDYDENIDRILK